MVIKGNLLKKYYKQGDTILVCKYLCNISEYTGWGMNQEPLNRKSATLGIDCPSKKNRRHEMIYITPPSSKIKLSVVMANVYYVKKGYNLFKNAVVKKYKLIVLNQILIKHNHRLQKD